jgi:dihydrodipicolinate reductase
MIKVGVSGANGTMGRLTIGAIDAVDDLTVGGLYAPGHDDRDILGHMASGDPAALSECNVVIELTNPAAADENVPRWRDSGADVLIGTSGYTVDRIDA